MIDPEELIHVAEEMQDSLRDMLTNKQFCDRYNRGKDARLAQIVKDTTSVEESMKLRESQALASPEWAQYLKEWDEFEQKYIAAKIQHDTLNNRFTALQSAMAYIRDGMRRGVL